MSEQQLIPLENVTASDLFGGADENKLNDLLAGIKTTAQKMAKGLKIDNKADREEMASVAYKVARSKTTLDTAGKDFVADLKNQAKIVDERRRGVREQLDTLRDEIRGPLNRWEENEQARIQGLTGAITEVREAGNDSLEGWVSTPLEELEILRAQMEAVDPSDYDEFEENMAETRLAALAKIDTAIAKRTQHDSEQAELEKLRKEKAEREEADRKAAAQKEQEEREEQIRKDAEAEAQRRTAQALENERREKEAAQQRQREAEERAENAKNEAALEQAREEQRQKDLQEARERNTRHKGKVNNEALEAIAAAGSVSPATAKKIVKAIAQGKIPHVVIEY